MKKAILFVSGIAVMLGMLFTSCNKEQSELNMDSMKDHAYITGKVLYNQGYVEKSGAVISDFMAPAAGQTVMVQVATSQYVGGAAGVQTFKATTDEKGEYKIEIPVDADGVNAQVSVVPFNADKTVLNDKKEKVILKDALYNRNVGPNMVALSAEKIETVDFLTVNTATEPETEYITNAVTVKGKVTTATWFKDKDTEEWTAEQRGLENAELEIETYVIDGLGNTVTLTVSTKTNESGEYSANLTLPSGYKQNTVQVKVTAQPKVVNEFTHHYKHTTDGWKTQTVAVLYKEASIMRGIGSVDYLVPATVGTLVVGTRPVDYTGIKGLDYSDAEVEHHDPLNWNSIDM